MRVVDKVTGRKNVPTTTLRGTGEKAKVGAAVVKEAAVEKDAVEKETGGPQPVTDLSSMMTKITTKSTPMSTWTEEN